MDAESIHRRYQERHLLDLEGIANALYHARRQMIEVQMGIEISRERKERSPVVVAPAIEQTIDCVLDTALDRGEQEHDDKRRQKREDGAVLVAHHVARAY